MQIKLFTLFIALCLFNSLLQTLSAPAGGTSPLRARPASPVRHAHESGQQSAPHQQPIVKDSAFHKNAAANAHAESKVWGIYAKGVAKTSAKGLLHGEFKDAAAGGALACMLGAACGARKASQIYHNHKSKAP